MSDAKGEAKTKGSNLAPHWLAMQRCPRCGAKTRKGTPCRAAAMKNGRCRMHGGKSTGPRTGSMQGNQNRFKHGLYSGEATAFRRQLARLRRSSHELAEKVIEEAS